MFCLNRENLLFYFLLQAGNVHCFLLWNHCNTSTGVYEQQTRQTFVENHALAHNTLSNQTTLKNLESRICVCVLEILRVCVLAIERGKGRERERETEREMEIANYTKRVCELLCYLIYALVFSLSKTHTLTHTHAIPPFAEGCTCERLEGQRQRQRQMGDFHQKQRRVVDSDVPDFRDKIYGH